MSMKGFGKRVQASPEILPLYAPGFSVERCYFFPKKITNYR
jgi:hypothetical protein